MTSAAAADAAAAAAVPGRVSVRRGSLRAAPPSSPDRRPPRNGWLRTTSTP